MNTCSLASFELTTSRGFSAVADLVSSFREKWLTRRLRSASYANPKEQAYTELYEVFQEALSPGWDGYGAEPVGLETLSRACDFLTALPSNLPPTSVGAEPDGHITLEWHRSVRRTLSISISPDGNLSWAMLFGARTNYGTEPFYGPLPDQILELINQIAA